MPRENSSSKLFTVKNDEKIVWVSESYLCNLPNFKTDEQLSANSSFLGKI